MPDIVKIFSSNREIKFVRQILDKLLAPMNDFSRIDKCQYCQEYEKKSGEKIGSKEAFSCCKAT